jgi:hypothetical protein
MYQELCIPNRVTQEYLVGTLVTLASPENLFEVDVCCFVDSMS